ncbi:hypothetical protein [Cerasicoccus fimbriatus]|uniref:hypothetical protein n=1 Tax=Cerasicoccus fimbriatus TaxID=3014554 RepID=UPI0022B2CF74|nr:hypothetical protein [Cerasicoccus sp. TK19100]
MQARFALAVLCAGLASAKAQPYSAPMADNDNPYDAPIPGFVGPGGEGKVNLEGYENPNGETYVNPIFTAWANQVIDYSPALGTHTNGETVVDPYWQYSGEMLGPVTGDFISVASLGDLDTAAIEADLAPGSVTLQFAEPISDYTGADFVVFENGYLLASSTGGNIWAELAYVEVSSNGIDYARFPSISLTENPVGPYGAIDATKVYNLAGKHVNIYGDCWGTPFDLSDLTDHPLVLVGKVDLDEILRIRLVDIPGSGDFLDSLGNPIYDGWVTWGSGGADIEAVGAIGQPVTYEMWDAGRGLDPDADPDGDGWNNAAEYAFLLDPEKADGGDVTRLDIVDGELVFSFPRDQRNANTNINYHIYVQDVADGESFSPTGWRSAAQFAMLNYASLNPEFCEGYTTVNLSPQASLGVRQRVRLTLKPTEDSSIRRFVRLNVEFTNP